MFTFLYPWLFLLLPAPWLVRWLVPPRRSAPSAVRVPFGERLSAILGAGGAAVESGAISGFRIVPILVWLIVVSALARPQWIEPPVVKEIPTRDLLLLVDLSGSMDEHDFENAEGKKVDRLTAVKEVLDDFLKRRKGDRVGLVVFGDAAYLQAPFSTDLSLSERLLNECQVGMAGPRTALGDAIGLGVNLFESSKAPAKTIIALTDGNDTKSAVPPVEAARVAAQRDIKIYTVAIGDPTTAGEDKLDEQALKDVAQATGGSYYFAADRNSLAGIYDQLDKIESHKVSTVSHRPRHDLFPWFVGAALAISMLEKLWVSLRGAGGAAPPTSSAKVHVNPRNGKLEVVS
ncbi:VWA domain-containing protein [Blastopirellula sp. JC732]|uniref:VWA domain-containing protein n=1 Tax=Blastopirellula sediminis TaxID=2894196 RepID=A0A9X1MMF5_9BACT|nr:VWA domain-containing protein [Blastopirellula sediminis]MCC9609049.1 VWA domain-containing protein [Blastopirellula sediminis]MCC9628174.1 VWA domain-containing protein [Blastopirellula sediminis]